MRYDGLLYRALNPHYARDPLSGSGAARFGGRFNKVGRLALYTALAPDTAIREANQVGTLQPTILVAFRANLTPVFDGRDADALARYDHSPASLADPGWRDTMLIAGNAPTQTLAERLVADGYVALLVPTYAPTAWTGVDGRKALNLVVWTWDVTSLIVVDDEHRLAALS